MHAAVAEDIAAPEDQKQEGEQQSRERVASLGR
jgi:hypothetical protein